ncbi:MAG: hypothetical protein HYR62_10710 [Actinobacteria bacterium]|nr:hypothetical protein [Actinomycetota bacterium]MBI3686778.1 hypothetical protein [Actinomycetota bacterium]
MGRTRRLFKSIDDYLGSGETRFFASGYRRAQYQVADIVLVPAGDPGPSVVAMVSVRYPADWSTKADRSDLRPHLSTVDMLVLSVQLSEAHLSHSYGLDPDLRKTMWLRKVSLRAGSAPQEDLAGLVGSATHRSTEPLSGSAGGFISTYDCVIGTMRASCEIVHPVGQPAREGRRHESLDGALGPAASRYYGDGFKLRRHVIEDVTVDIDALRASANVQVRSLPGGQLVTDGVDGAWQPAVSAVDCFVANLQLAQVLLYELDSIRREDSNTLWMLKTTLEIASPPQRCISVLPAEAAITKKYLVPLRGAQWRNVDINGTLGNVILRSSFAHEIPSNLATGTDG